MHEIIKESLNVSIYTYNSYCLEYPRERPKSLRNKLNLGSLIQNIRLEYWFSTVRW